MNEIEALSDVKLTVTPSDSGDIFKMVVTPAFSKTNSIENLYTILTYTEGIKSSDGTIEGNNVRWFRSKQFLNTTKDIGLYANLVAGTRTLAQTEVGDKNEKSCGLFGIELPLIFLSGMLVLRRIKTKK